MQILKFEVLARKITGTLNFSCFFAFDLGWKDE
jgi:hypothetical protein